MLSKKFKFELFHFVRNFLIHLLEIIKKREKILLKNKSPIYSKEISYFAQEKSYHMKRSEILLIFRMSFNLKKKSFSEESQIAPSLSSEIFY